MNRKPIETENQDGYFACEGCRDERCHEEQDLRVDAEGVCWCEDCYGDDHTQEEWDALKRFVPERQIDIARKDAEIAALTRKLCEVVKNRQTTITPTIAGSASSSSEPKAEKADAPETSGQPTPSEGSPLPTKPDASAGKMFVVIAHRGGDPENHSYPVGIATNLPMAVLISKNAEAYRGGKYACSIWKFDVDQWDLEAETEEVYGWPKPIPGWKTAVERIQESIRVEGENRRLRAELERIARTCRAFDGCPVGPNTIAEMCDDALVLKEEKI